MLINKKRVNFYTKASTTRTIITRIFPSFERIFFVTWKNIRLFCVSLTRIIHKLIDYLLFLESRLIPKLNCKYLIIKNCEIHVLTTPYKGRLDAKSTVFFSGFSNNGGDFANFANLHNWNISFFQTIFFFAWIFELWRLYCN